jgi:hypothetical protein
VRVLSVDSASDRLAGPEDLLDGAGQVLGEGLVTHSACNVDDLVEADVPAVLDVLLLLAITRGL